MSRTGRLVSALLVAVLAAGCGTSADGADRAVPTIGLGSDLGDLDALGSSGGAELIGGAVAADSARIDSVVVVGDSITVGSQGPLEEALAAAGFPSARVAAQQGKRMAVSTTENPSGAVVAGFVRDAGGVDGDDDHSDELWVIALGTNDIAQYADPAQIAAAVNEVLAAVPAESPVVWVDTYWRDRPDDAARVNQVIRARIEARGNAVVAPWSAFAGADGILDGDGVHPTTEGSAAFATVVAATVSAFLDR